MLHISNNVNDTCPCGPAPTCQQIGETARRRRRHFGTPGRWDARALRVKPAEAGKGGFGLGRRFLSASFVRWYWPRFSFQLSPGPQNRSVGGGSFSLRLRLPHPSIPPSKPKIPSTLVRARPPPQKGLTHRQVRRATSHGRQIDMKQQLTTLGLSSHGRPGPAWSKYLASALALALGATLCRRVLIWLGESGAEMGG